MTTLTATPDVATAAVTLEVTPATGESITGILRSDVNGTRPVRVPAGTWPLDATRVHTLVDHEAALSGAILYRLQDQGLGADVWTSLDGVTLPRFSLPYSPAVQVVVETVTADEGTRESRSTVHEIIDREDPVLALGRLRTRAGELVVVCSSWHQVQSLEGLAESGQVILYRQPENPGRDMYLAVSSLRTVPEADVWVTTLGYRELAWPTGDLARPFSWTFLELARRGGSFDQVAQDYRTFHDLAAGEEIL